MRLLDSNIVIYATQPEHAWLADALQPEPFLVSVITQIEVLGYHQLTEEDERDLRAFLAAAEIVPVNDEVTRRAISLRQARKIGLADAIIAATALVKDCELATRNVTDFAGIEGLQIWNPF